MLFRSISISGTALPYLTKVKAYARPEKLHKFGAAGIFKLIQKHLRGLEMTRKNRMGFPRSHFWSNSAKSTTWGADSSRGFVEVAREGFRQRLYGGVIRPVNVSALTIPLHPRAYNHRAREFNLRFVPKLPSDPPTVVGYLSTPFSKKGRNFSLFGEWY